MEVIYAILLTAYTPFPCSGGVLDLPVGARPVSLGGAYTAAIGSPEVFFFNPASLAALTDVGMSFFATNLYQMKELQYAAVSGNVSCTLGNWGWGIKSFGNNLYRENSAGLGWAFRPANNVYCGLAVKRQELRIKSYGSESIFLFDLGILYKIGKTVTMGVVASNLRKLSNSAYQQSVPLTYRSGLSWKAVPDVLVCIDLVWMEDLIPDYRLGIECQVLEKCWIRCGMEQTPPCFSTGIGLKWKIIKIDYAVRFHNYLGSTHYCSVSFAWR